MYMDYLRLNIKKYHINSREVQLWWLKCEQRGTSHFNQLWPQPKRRVICGDWSVNKEEHRASNRSDLKPEKYNIAWLDLIDGIILILCFGSFLNLSFSFLLQRQWRYILICNTRRIVCNTRIIVYNTRIIICNTRRIVCNTRRIVCNTRRIVCNTRIQQLINLTSVGIKRTFLYLLMLPLVLLCIPLIRYFILHE